MAAFISKTDYFNLETKIPGLVCTTNEDGKSAELAEATGSDGSIVASNVYGEKIAPSNEYAVTSGINMSADTIALGDVTTTTDGATTKHICLNSIEIGTSAGSAPTVKASGEQVEAVEGTEYCKYSLPAIALASKHHAQILMDAFALTGAGCHLKSANYTFSASISKAEKEGECLAHDVTGGKIECSIEVLRTGTATPSLSAGTDWEITSPLACSNPDSDWPTYSATLTKYLSK